jgi:hypothetical protein
MPQGRISPPIPNNQQITLSCRSHETMHKPDSEHTMKDSDSDTVIDMSRENFPPGILSITHPEGLGKIHEAVSRYSSIFFALYFCLSLFIFPSFESLCQTRLGNFPMGSELLFISTF